MYHGLFYKIVPQLFLKCILTNSEYYFAVRKNRFSFIHSFKISRDQSCHPAAAVNNIRRPTEFLNCFQGSFTKENGSQPIILKPFIIFIMKKIFSSEEIFIIEEIDL